MIFDFISEEDKQEIKQQQLKNIDIVKAKLKDEGLTDYQVERKVEEIFMKPDSLSKFDNNKSDLFESVAFYFTEEEFTKFTKVFKISRFMETTCNQTWLLLELVRLLEEGKLKIDNKEKKVMING